MNISDFKVRPEDYEGRDISSLPDRPALSAAELKARFDSPAKVVLGSRFNQMIDALSSEKDGESGAHYIASAPVSGLTTLDGEAAVNIGDQIEALQRNMKGVANNELADESIDGAKIVNGTISSEKLSDADGNIAKIVLKRLTPNLEKNYELDYAEICVSELGTVYAGDRDGTAVPAGQTILELPVAAGENLNTPCVVKLAGDGVRTPKYGCLRASREVRQVVLENTNNILNGTTVVPLYGNFAVVSYSKKTSTAYVPVVLIAKMENGFITEKQVIHTGATNSSTAKVPIRLRQSGKNTWMLCLIEPYSGASFVYAFSFDGEIYQQLAKYTGTVNTVNMESRFSFISSNTVLIKYFTSPSLYGVVVKFSSGLLTNGGATVLDTINGDYPVIGISDNRCILQTNANNLRVINIDGVNITAGAVFTYTKALFGIARVSHNRFAAFSSASSSIECAFMNISDTNVITAETSQKVLGYGSGTPTAAVLSGEYIKIIHTIEKASGDTVKGNSVFRVTESGVKHMGTSVWPRYTTLSDEAAIAEPIPQYNNPYVMSCNANGSATVMTNGMVSCGTYLENVECAGIALSVDGGKARVLVSKGVVTGFSDLTPGVAYSLGYDGQICDVGDHPLALRVGVALDESTLWFNGN